MKTFRTEIFRTLVSLGVIAAGVAGMQMFGQKPAPEKQVQNGTEAVLVEAVEISAHHGGLDMEVDGLTVPFREIQLAAEVAGRVIFKADECRKGRAVAPDTPLIRIDPETYDLKVQQLRHRESEANQNINELAVEIQNTQELIPLAESDLKLRENELSRQRRLKDSRVGTNAAFEDAQRLRLQSENALRTLRNQERLLTKRRERLVTSRALVGVELKQAQLDLARTKITSPVAGVVVREMVETDSWVQKGAELVTIEDTRQVEVRCSLTMEEVYRLWQSAVPDSERGEYDVPPADVTVLYELAGRTFVWTGRLARYDGIGLDEKTRTVPCRIVVAQPRQVDEILPSGSRVKAVGGPPALIRNMFVRAKIHTQPDSPIVRIPLRAVRPGHAVWLIREGRLVIARAVVAGRIDGFLLANSKASGIVPGDRAIVSPLSEAVPGAAVTEQAP